MKKRIKQFFKVIQFMFTKPKDFIIGGYDKAIFEEKKKYVKEKLNFVEGLSSIKIEEYVGKEDVEINPYSFLGGSSDISDIMFLIEVAKEIKDLNNMKGTDYLEIGTWRGESIANIAKVLDNCVSLNLSSKQLFKIGYSKDYIELQDFLIKGIKNISYIKDDSTKYNFSSIKNKFDMIFIDGDHRYEAVKKDTENAFKLLKNKDSVIVWHDYGLNPESINYPVLAGILDGTPKEELNFIYKVPNTKCAIFTKKELESEMEEYYQKPKNNFKVNVCLNKLDG